MDGGPREVGCSDTSIGKVPLATTVRILIEQTCIEKKTEKRQQSANGDCSFVCILIYIRPKVISRIR